ncbi:hypothetical protein DPMN_109585 [Dreissena polymorpha]|uniref:Uncharacterized protein n=1 Tax=Dreissena polymorpha TaxID=45954 RepID=A0A9D4KB06_DREPO|nr:hypothetical protein DPMN_109585 [Dreissena polymorpha]
MADLRHVKSYHAAKIGGAVGGTLGVLLLFTVGVIVYLVRGNLNSAGLLWTLKAFLAKAALWLRLHSKSKELDKASLGHLSTLHLIASTDRQKCCKLGIKYQCKLIKMTRGTMCEKTTGHTI